MIHFKYEVIHVNQINNFSNSTAKTDKKHVINLNQIMKKYQRNNLDIYVHKKLRLFLTCIGTIFKIRQRLKSLKGTVFECPSKCTGVIYFQKTQRVGYQRYNV